MASPSSIPPRRSLKTDPANKPTSDVSLDSPHWVDQLPVAKVSGLGSLLGPTNLYVNGSTGVDATALRGNGIAWATLSAAIAKALPGDAIVVQSCGNTGNAPSLSGIVTVPTGVAIRGDGSDNARVSVTNAASLVYTAGTTCKIEGVSFYGPVAATAIAGALISLNQASAVSIKNCRFANFNQTAINAIGVSHTLIQGNTFDHVGGAFLGDDIPNAYNTDFVFDGNTSEWTFSGTYIFHSPSSYNAVSNGDTIPSALAFSRTFRITNNVARYAGFGNQAGNGVLAFEIWHGWTGGVIANNVAEDSYFGFSIDRTTNTVVSNNRAQHCTFQFEFNTCTNVTAEDNIADTRPSASSPFANTTVNSIVIFDGNCTDCTWKGGAVIGGYVHFYGSGVRNCSITGAQIKSAFIYAQHPTGNCEAVGNRFSKEVSLPRANFWLLIDTSGDANGPSTIPRLAFNQNTLNDGVNQNGIEYVYANTGTITRFEIENNVSDLVPCGTAYYHGGVEPAITSHSFKENYTLNSNGPFPNTDNAASGMNSGVFTPAAYGAAGNGTTDDTQAIQQAINAAQAASGVVELGSVHRIDGQIHSYGVAILGRNFTAAKHAQANNSTGDNQTLTNGTVLFITGGAGGSDTDQAAITLYENASLHDVTIFYPNQLSSQATPTPYPYAVRILSSQHAGVTVSTGGQMVRNVELLNAYCGIECLTGSVRLENITGTPLLTGIRVDNAPDTIWLSRIEFNPWWNYGTASASWVLANGTAFEIGRVDELMADHCLAFYYRYGVHTFDSSTAQFFQGSGYGTFDTCSFDTCTTCVLVDGRKANTTGGELGWEFNGCKFGPNNTTAGVGIGVLLATGNTACVALNGGRFWAALDTAVLMQGAGEILVRSVLFKATTQGDLIRVTGNGNVIVQNNLFDTVPGGQHVNITATGAVGKVSGNFCGAYLKYQNASSTVSVESTGGQSGLQSGGTAINATSLTGSGDNSYQAVAGASLTIPFTGAVTLKATLRVSLLMSNVSDGGFISVRLVKNGNSISGTTRLVVDFSQANVAFQTTEEFSWDVGCANNDVFSLQAKRDGNVTWSTSNIASDSNGYSLFEYVQIR